MVKNDNKSTVVQLICLIVLMIALWVGSAPTVLAQSKQGTLPTVKVPKKKKKVKVPKARRQPKQVKDKRTSPRTQKSSFGGSQPYQAPRTKSTSGRVRSNYQQPRTKSGGGTVLDRYQKPKTKTSSGNVYDRYQRPKSKTRSGNIYDRYQRPKTKTSSGKVQDRYQKPQTITNSGKVRDSYQRPPTLSPSGVVKDRYRVPQSVSRSGKVRDTYRRPESISPSGKIRITEGREAPSAEEGRDRAHLPFADRIFHNQRHLRKKSKALEKASNQTSNYQGGNKVGIFYSKERYYKKADRRQTNVGEYRVPHQFQQKKVEENYSKYVHQHRGYMRVPTRRANSRYFKKLARRVQEYNGDIVRHKRGKDMHPSVDYLAGRQKNTYEKKEKYRKRRIWFSHIFKSKDQPKHLKENTRKPRYDKKEADIWYY